MAQEVLNYVQVMQNMFQGSCDSIQTDSIKWMYLSMSSGLANWFVYPGLLFFTMELILAFDYLEKRLWNWYLVSFSYIILFKVTLKFLTFTSRKIVFETI